MCVCVQASYPAGQLVAETAASAAHSRQARQCLRVGERRWRGTQILGLDWLIAESSAPNLDLANQCIGTPSNTIGVQNDRFGGRHALNIVSKN